MGQENGDAKQSATQYRPVSSSIRLRFPLRSLASFAALAFASSLPAQVFVVGLKSATADVTTEFHPTHIELPTGTLDQRGRLDLIRNLESEQGFAHRELPLGPGLELVANGNMFPHDDDYKAMLYKRGQSAAPGDRMEVSALSFSADAITLDFNGGPYAKHRFLSHISLNDIPLAQRGPEATGCRITLIFEGGVPAISAAEVKALLEPLVDFKARSSAEAYTNTLSPQLRAAIESHDILVGMDRRMVLASVGEPLRKHREAPDPASTEMQEEWIYGQPPQDTRFVRFRSGRVIRLEIAALGKPIEVHDQNEVLGPQAPALLARTVLNGDAQPTADEGRRSHPPTLRQPGEVLDPTASTTGKVHMPTDPQPASKPQ